MPNNTLSTCGETCVAGHMWERRSYCDGISWRCTVKFAGTIPPWGETAALGVEWDEPSRGRNNGDINGIQYFTCRVPDAGSFVKASRKYDNEISLGEAIYNKYVKPLQFTEIELGGGKSIETVGVEKLQREHEQIEILAVVSVEACCVKSVAGGPISIGSLYSLERLDLSNNLLESFGEVLDLVLQLPHLTWLRLNGNRMQFQDETKVCTHLRNLEMSNTLVFESDIATLSTCFPMLQTLSLAQNRLITIPPVLPSHLSTLDLSHNFITNLDYVPSSLHALFISDNGITEISGSLWLPQILDIQGHILSWESISNLGGGDTVDLHITYSEAPEAAHRPLIIARCPNLRKLNGTIVSFEERVDAEMYTINSVHKKKHPMLPEHVWQNLIARYGKPAPLPDRSIRARLITFYIGDSQTPLRILKDAPVPRLLRQIARATHKPLHEIRIRGVNDEHMLDEESPHWQFTVEEIVQDGSRLQLL